MNYFWLGAKTFLMFFVMVYSAVRMYVIDDTTFETIWFSMWCVSLIVLMELIEKFDRELKCK